MDENMQQQQQLEGEQLNSPLPAPFFTTPRLIARPMHPQDAVSAQLACEPESITRYMTLAFAHPYTLAHAQGWIAMNQEVPYNHLYLTLHTSPATIIGGIGLKPGADVNAHTGEVGYWLAESHQGQGLMREALAAFVDWTFASRTEYLARQHPDANETPKTRLWAGVFAPNISSMHILGRCGFSPEGVMRGHVVSRGGETLDLHMYGLTKEDWMATRERDTTQV